ncbi:YfmQ family protein [Bacillus sp. RIT 809]|uniref:YfmQ family protein n=1 Tax=Bacillus sp. RIT 809 TaxID=2803857 RepID=UPI0019510CF8|nr:YfmQ family protein [Bacillus sp. RIT 809]MBM6644576.1 YfmQ family protein [Bacillus sp. RIT 809]
MTTWFIVLLVVFGAFKIIVSSLPNSVIESIISRYETHPQLDEENVTVTINGNSLEGDKKSQIITDFNEGLFLDRYYAPPQNEGTPLIINAKRGKKDFTFYIYSHEEHVDVIKQHKKKIVAYSLRSKNLQNNDMFVSADIV